MYTVFLSLLLEQAVVMTCMAYLSLGLRFRLRALASPTHRNSRQGICLARVAPPGRCTPQILVVCLPPLLSPWLIWMGKRTLPALRPINVLSVLSSLKGATCLILAFAQNVGDPAPNVSADDSPRSQPAVEICANGSPVAALCPSCYDRGNACCASLCP